MDIPDTGGSYIIVYLLKDESPISIGKLGIKHFLPGVYYYCGSAKGPGGLKSRISRHLNPKTKNFWHIDYFKQLTEPVCAWFSTDNAINECTLVQKVEKIIGAQKPVPGFGSSDCKEKCGSHLLYIAGSGSTISIYKKLKKEITDLNEKLVNKFK